MLRAKLETKDAFRALDKAISKADKSGTVTVEELAQIGKQTARSLAPYKDGYLFRKIRIRRDIGNEAVVFAGNPLNDYPEEQRKKRARKFPLVKWMHEHPNARTAPKSGHPDFMYKAAEQIAGIMFKVAERNYKKQN